MLQPGHVFKGECTRLNELYWTSSYAFRRSSALLTALASTGQQIADPRVDALWPSNSDGERRHITLPVSQFSHRLDTLLDALRFTSILHMCSAFENALTNYYALGVLYSPTVLKSTCKMYEVPRVLSSRARFEALEKAAFAGAGELSGEYSRRLTRIMNRFTIVPVFTVPSVRLDDYYTKRHLIAHDQSLTSADGTTRSAREVLLTRGSMAENDWLQMLRDFVTTIEELDVAIAGVVHDGGLALAVHRIIDRDGQMRLGTLRHKLSAEWRMEVKFSQIEQSAKLIGLTVGQERTIRSRTVKRS